MFFKKSDKCSGSTYSYIIAGLGNPGLQYEKTRHNVGFRAVDALCKSYNKSCDRHKFQSLYTDLVIDGNRCLVLKPETFMNNSGQAIHESMQFYKIPLERVIVISDDISLDVGRLRIRAKGSAGGHNGLKDIIEINGADNFPRVKIGVGKKPHPEYDLKDWVLGKFPKEQEALVEETAALAAQAVECIIKNDIPTAMNRFNK